MAVFDVEHVLELLEGVVAVDLDQVLEVDVINSRVAVVPVHVLLEVVAVLVAEVALRARVQIVVLVAHQVDHLHVLAISVHHVGEMVLDSEARLRAFNHLDGGLGVQHLDVLVPKQRHAAPHLHITREHRVFGVALGDVDDDLLDLDVIDDEGHPIEPAAVVPGADILRLDPGDKRDLENEGEHVQVDLLEVALYQFLGPLWDGLSLVRGEQLSEVVEDFVVDGEFEPVAVSELQEICLEVVAELICRRPVKVEAPFAEIIVDVCFLVFAVVDLQELSLLYFVDVVAQQLPLELRFLRKN